MREQIERLIIAVADAWEAKANQARTLTNKRLQEEWESGYRSGYQTGKSKREERRRAARGGTVHRCPPAGSGEMPCCGRTPFDVMSDRMTLDDALVTCHRTTT